MKKQIRLQKKNKKKKRNKYMTFIQKYTIMVVLILALLFCFWWFGWGSGSASQPTNIITEDSLNKYLDSQIEMSADTLPVANTYKPIDSIHLRRP